MSANTPTIERQQAALKAARDLLHYWAGPPEIPVTSTIPPCLQQAVDVLDGVKGLDMLKLVYDNRPTISSLLR